MSGHFQRQAEEGKREAERLAQVDADLEATDTMLQAKCREVDALIEERKGIRAELAKVNAENAILLDQLAIIAKEDMLYFEHTKPIPGRFAEMALGALPRDKALAIGAHHKALIDEWVAEKTRK